MGEVRNRNILIGIVDNDPYALKVFGTLIERMSSDFAVIYGPAIWVPWPSADA